MTLNWDLISYILGAIIAVASALSAYFSQQNHKILNGGSTVQITHRSISTAATPTAPAEITKSIVVDGITYDQRV